MRFLTFCMVFLAASPSDAALPIRKPEVEAVIEKVVPATPAEQEAGLLVTLLLKGRNGGVLVTKDTQVHRQMGKLVPVVAAGDIQAGQKASVWIDGRTGKAEGVLIFP
jgi:hypothetical protein